MKLLSAVLLFAPMIAFAADQFDGTWRVNLQNAQLATKPARWEVANGMFKCLDCDPPYAVKANGQDQPNTATPRVDTSNVRIVDPNKIEIVHKKNGKVVAVRKYTVSADGNAATLEYTFYREGIEKPITGTVKYSRVAKGPAGSHAFSGSWLPQKEETSENNLMFTCKTTANGLSMTTGTGESFDAKFDGKDYPYKGDPRTTSVLLKRIDPNTIEETDKRDGKAISTTRMTISADGRTMKMVSHDLKRNDTSIATAEKQ